MNRDQIIKWLKIHNGCDDSIEWILKTSGTPANLWRRCPQGDWLLWLHEEVGLPWEGRESVTYEIVNRAVRVVAPRMLSFDGRRDEAKLLRSLDPIVNRRTVTIAANVATTTYANCAATAARNALWAASFASKKRSAWSAASAARYAVLAAAWNSRAAVNDAACAAENRRHATMVRRHIRLEDVIGAMENSKQKEG